MPEANQPANLVAKNRSGGLTRRAVLSLFPAALFGRWFSLRSGRANPTPAPGTAPVSSSAEPVLRYEYYAYDDQIPDLGGGELVTLETTYVYNDDGRLVSFTAEPPRTIAAFSSAKPA